jgi:outer membrane lipoprotein-sorting protein
MNMKRSLLLQVCVMLLLGAAAFGQNAALDKVLTAMDRQAAAFRNAQANFVWDQYTRVVDDHDIQEGTIYFRRLQKNEVQMAADITQANGKPIAKVVLFTDGKVKLYEAKIDRVTEYDAGKNKAAFESFLVLGFGGSGHDLLKSFEVKYDGTEKVQGVEAAKLDLTPKSPKVRGMFNRIILWIDPARGISVQQQFFDPDGNYRLAKYSDIKLNEKINDDVFKLKTTSHTTYVRPNS